MSVQFVIARYNEPIDWVSNTNENVIIYNKGAALYGLKNVISLPNVGREAHTYLYHIIANYDSLSDITIFSQAKIADHGYPEDVRALRTQLTSHISSHGCSPNHRSYTKGTIHWADPDFNVQIRDILIDTFKVPAESVDKIVFHDWFRQFIQTQYPDPLCFYKGAIFAVTREQIHTRPKHEYERLLAQLQHENAPIEAHFLERSWYYLFHCNKS